MTSESEVRRLLDRVAELEDELAMPTRYCESCVAAVQAAAECAAAKADVDKLREVVAQRSAELFAMKAEVGRLNSELAAKADVLDLVEFAQRVHSNAVAHGWHDKDRTFGDFVALVHSELSEALEAYRAPGLYADRVFHLGPGRPPKPEGMLPELADVVIRILDYTEATKSTPRLVEALRMKHAYNLTRPHLHGGKNL